MNNGITTTRLFTIGVPIAIAAAVLTGTLALGLSNNNNNVPNGNNNNGAEAAGGSPCLPTSLASIKLAPGWIIKQPTSLPKGYTLEGVLDNQPADIELLYADHSLCNFPSGFDYQGHQMKIVAVHPGRLINGTENQQIFLAHAADPSSGIVAKVQPIEVNGYKGAGWGQFDAYSTVRLNGTVIHQEPFHGQANLFFFNDNDQVEYSLFGHANQTLTELLDVARSVNNHWMNPMASRTGFRPFTR
jgi:hypothetical protein